MGPSNHQIMRMTLMLTMMTIDNNKIQDHRRWRYYCTLLDYQSPWFYSNYLWIFEPLGLINYFLIISLHTVIWDNFGTISWLWWKYFWVIEELGIIKVPTFIRNFLSVIMTMTTTCTDLYCIEYHFTDSIRVQHESYTTPPEIFISKLVIQYIISIMPW